MATKTTKTSVKKTTVKKESSLQAPLYSVSGERTGSIDLPKNIFGVLVNKQLIAQAVRVYRANQRQGTASTKTRGEVEGSTRKIYKQKGTGRARHGGIRAPIFVGGGIVFGPRPRDYSLILPKAMKEMALKSACSHAVKEESVCIVDGAQVTKPKTKIVALGFKKMGIHASILLVVDDMHSSYVRAAKNIEGVTIVLANLLTTYDMFTHKHICMTKEALAQLEKRCTSKK